MFMVFAAVVMFGAVGSAVWAAQKAKFNLAATGLDPDVGQISAVPKFGQYPLSWGKKTAVNVDINGDSSVDLSDIIRYYENQADCATDPSYAIRHASICPNGPSPARN
jgi:hypothetical protein